MKALLIFKNGALLTQEVDYYPMVFFMPKPEEVKALDGEDLTFGGAVIKFIQVDEIGPYWVYKEI